MSAEEVAKIVDTTLGETFSESTFDLMLRVMTAAEPRTVEVGLGKTSIAKYCTSTRYLERILDETGRMGRTILEITRRVNRAYQRGAAIEPITQMHNLGPEDMERLTAIPHELTAPEAISFMPPEMRAYAQKLLEEGRIRL